MKLPSIVAKSGLFSSIVQTINDNFTLLHNQILSYFTDCVKFCGAYATESALKSAYTTAQTGAYAYVTKDDSNWYVYRWDGTEWVNSEETIAAGNVTINNYEEGGDAKLAAALTVGQSVGKLSVGTTYSEGTSIEQILRDMLEKAKTQATISSSASPSQVEVGTDESSVTIKFVITKNDSGDLDDTSLAFTWEGNDKVDKLSKVDSGSSITITYTPTSGTIFTEGAHTALFSATMKKSDYVDQKVFSNVSATVNAYYKEYIGFVDSSKKTITADTIKSEISSYLSSGSLCTAKTISVNKTLTSEDGILIIVPSSLEPSMTNLIQNGTPFQGTNVLDGTSRTEVISGTINVTYGTIAKTYYYKYIHTPSPMTGSISFTLTIN